MQQKNLPLSCVIELLVEMASGSALPPDLLRCSTGSGKVVEGPFQQKERKVRAGVRDQSRMERMLAAKCH